MKSRIDLKKLKEMRKKGYSINYLADYFATSVSNIYDKLIRMGLAGRFDIRKESNTRKIYDVLKKNGRLGVSQIYEKLKGALTKDYISYYLWMLKRKGYVKLNEDGTWEIVKEIKPREVTYRK